MSTVTLAEALIEFPDNRLLIDLCGPYDGHLTAIENALEVQIIRRGNVLVLLGEEAAQARAQEILQALYLRLEGGKEVAPADVDRELRMGGADVDTDTQETDQLKKPANNRIEIKTRKKLVEPRTDAQKAYVQSLFDQELAFGIGPAGTCLLYTSPSPRD